MNNNDDNVIIEKLKLLKEIQNSGSCNDCANKECGYKPKPGQLIRYNCPFYKAKYINEVCNNAVSKEDVKSAISIVLGSLPSYLNPIGLHYNLMSAIDDLKPIQNDAVSKEDVKSAISIVLGSLPSYSNAIGLHYKLMSAIDDLKPIQFETLESNYANYGREMKNVESQLPDYICDIVVGYLNYANHKFYEDSSYITEIVSESNKIYITKDTNKKYKWNGTKFIEIGG